jgi:hypothetical protein
MIEAIGNSKLRRMERELELRGIRLDRSNNDWAERPNSGRSRPGDSELGNRKARHPGRPVGFTSV